LAYNLSGIACGPRAGSIKVMAAPTFHRWLSPSRGPRSVPECPTPLVASQNSEPNRRAFACVTLCGLGRAALRSPRTWMRPNREITQPEPLLRVNTRRRTITKFECQMTNECGNPNGNGTDCSRLAHSYPDPSRLSCKIRQSSVVIPVSDGLTQSEKRAFLCANNG
jgi:hypothetical protein